MRIFAWIIFEKQISIQDKNNNSGGGGRGSTGGKGSGGGAHAPVVCITNARMSYGKGANRAHVLNDLTMTVERGTM